MRKGKSKILYISNQQINPEHNSSSGIDITYIKSRDTLWISGWYDGCVGIGGTEITVDKFCELLGIKR